MDNISAHTTLIPGNVNINPYINNSAVSKLDSLHIAPEAEIVTFQSVVLGPEWIIAKQTWGYAWEIHIDVLGGLFGLLEVYNIVNVVRLWRCQRQLPTGYFVCLHAMIACICLTRSVYLLYFRYDSEQTCHVSLNHFLYSIPFPCLTSAFGLLFSWILSVADARLISFSLLKLQVLVPIIAMHYLLIVITDVLIGYSTGIQVVQFVNHAFFIIWSLILFFGYAYIFRKLYSQIVIGQTQTIDLPHDRSVNNTDSAQCKQTLGTAVKITFLTATCGLAVSGLEAYAVVDVYKIFTRSHPKPWQWWLYHSVLRLLEFFICVTMSYTISLPLRYQLSERKSLSRVLCMKDSCCNYKASGPNSLGECIYTQCFSTRSVHRSNSNTSEYCSTRHHSDGCSDTAQMVKTQSKFCATSNSLVIVDDVYVRFETDHDINRIVDSFNEFSKRPGAFQEISRLTHLADFVNTGDEVENDVKKEEYCDDSEVNVDEFLRSNIATSEMFRAPSSVSIAESMEKELARAFESIKAERTDVDNEF